MADKSAAQNIPVIVWMLLGSTGIFLLVLCGIFGLIIVGWAALNP